jgi:septal ring factor EnvC (AmiA/AmiB activator)
MTEAVLIATITTVGAVLIASIQTLRHESQKLRKENRADHGEVMRHLQAVGEGLSGVRADVADVKADVADVKADVRGLKADVRQVEDDVVAIGRPSAAPVRKSRRANGG